MILQAQTRKMVIKRRLNIFFKIFKLFNIFYLKEKQMTMVEKILLNKNCVTDTRLLSELVQYLNSPREENLPGFDVSAR